MPKDREACLVRRLMHLLSLQKDIGAKGLAYLAVNEDGTYKSSFAKFMTEEEIRCSC